MDDLLYNLGTIIQQQYNLSDNQIHSLSVDDDGTARRYGRLGDFANRFDQSAQRSYFEQGYTTHSMLPKAFEVMSQEPNITVLIKKKQFSSLSPHNRQEYMDREDKEFLRASTELFQNKCNQ